MPGRDGGYGQKNWPETTKWRAQNRAMTTKRIRQLLQKNNRGTISAAERLTLEKYLRVGQLLDLLHAKAKLSLHQNGDSQ